MGRILLGFGAQLLSLTANAQTTSQISAANQLFDREDYAQAAAAFERLPEAEKPAAVLNRLGISYHMSNRLREAENIYRRLIRVSPNSAAGYNNLGALFYSQKRFGEA